MIATVTIGCVRVGMLSFRGSKRRQLAIPVLVVALLAGCGGGGGSTSDTEAVTTVLTEAVGAVGDADGDKACGYLTPDAQRQAVLQLGSGVLNNVDCATLVRRATAFLSPLDLQQIKNLEPQNVQVNGTQASATVATPTGGPPDSRPMSVQLTLTKVGDDWKVSGFQNAVGLPGS